ncbi:MAG: hypothetical protein L6R48_10045 [Planctomycetes bacterium]|nr:hypothetical protein [Planctomycetota bacterium]
MSAPLRHTTDLCGRWDFAPVGQPAATIPVPAQWTHGTSYDLPAAWSAVRRATYARDLPLPPHREGRLLRLRFAAVMLTAQVRLAGEDLGGHRGGFTPFTLAIPDALWRRHAGASVRLEVEVESGHAANDGQRLLHQIGYPDDNEEGPVAGGIWQPVELEELPLAHLAGWRHTWDHRRRRLALDLDLSGAPAGARVEVRLGRDRGVVGNGLAVVEGRARGVLAVPTALAAWSWRQPRLHPLAFTLVDAHGRALDRLDTRLGLREVELRGETIRWNGEPLRLRGLSLIRQRVAPWLWRRDYLRLWFTTLRRLGFNSLRLHAAIAPAVVLEVMEEVGLVAIDQSAVWSTAVAGYTAGGEEFLANTCREFDAWIARDRNRACVLAFDVENEMSSIDPVNAPPWVDRLLAHVRTRTGLPAIASAAGTLTTSAMVHLHCAQAQRRMLPVRGLGRPLVLGEWWGPDKAYRDTLRVPSRSLADPRSERSHFRALAAFYGREIAAHRLGGAAGSFPFALDVLLFRPPFAPGAAIPGAPARPGEPPLLRSELYHRDSNYHVVRRPQVDPGWSDGRPHVRLDPDLARAVAAGHRPLLLAAGDLDRDTYGGRTLRRRVAVANDTGAALAGTVTVRLVDGGGRVLARAAARLALADGRSSTVAVRLRLPAVAQPTRLRLEMSLRSRTARAQAQGELWVWPAPAAIPAPGLPVAALGVAPALVAHLRRRGLALDEVAALPAHPAVVLAGRLPAACERAAVEAFLAAGGRLVLLRQEQEPAAVPLPLRLRRADETIPPVHHGLRQDPTLFTWQETAAFADPDHPLLAGLPGEGLRPFAAGDHRLADHAWVRPGVNPPPFSGPLRVLVGGADRAQAALVELPGAHGLVLSCQLHLEANCGRDPQADALITRLIAHAAAWRPATGASACAEPALAARLAALTGMPCADHGRLRVVAQPAEAAALLAALADPGHPETRRLRAGGTLLVLAAPGLDAGGVACAARPAGPLLAAAVRPGSEPLGWSSLDLDEVLDHDRLGLLAGDRRWRPRILAAPQDPGGLYAGFRVGEPCGALLLSRALGRGTVWVAGLPLATLAGRRGDLLWLQALSALGIAVARPAETSDDLVPARRSPSFAFAGELRRWTNEEADLNLAPWSRAQPVAVDERHRIVRGNGAPPAAYRRGAVFYLLHDGGDLLVAAQVLAPSFDFDGVAVAHYRKDSIEVRVGGTYVLASRAADGGLFIHTIGSRDDAGAPRRITGRVTLRPPAGGPDLHRLRLDHPPACEAFYELRIPRDLIAATLAPGAPPAPCALAWNAAVEGPERRLQCGFPADHQWNDQATWGRLALVAARS